MHDSCGRPCLTQHSTHTLLPQLLVPSRMHSGQSPSPLPRHPAADHVIPFARLKPKAQGCTSFGAHFATIRMTISRRCCSKASIFLTSQYYSSNSLYVCFTLSHNGRLLVGMLPGNWRTTPSEICWKGTASAMQPNAFVRMGESTLTSKQSG